MLPGAQVGCLCGFLCHALLGKLGTRVGVGKRNLSLLGASHGVGWGQLCSATEFPPCCADSLTKGAEPAKLRVKTKPLFVTVAVAHPQSQSELPLALRSALRGNFLLAKKSWPGENTQIEKQRTPHTSLPPGPECPLRELRDNTTN